MTNFADKVRQTQSMQRRGLGPDTGDHILAGPIFVDRSAQKVPQKMQTGAGAPSHCWYCFNQLRRARGKGLGLFYFNIVTDRDDVQHRVHGFPCTRLAIDDGCRLVTP